MDNYRDKLDSLLRDYDHAKRSVSEGRRALRQAKRNAKATHEAHDIIEQISRELQQQAHTKIASVVTKCLQIFDDPYEFRIQFERKRNQTEARLVFVRDGLEIDPLSGAGGGVVDVASFALRLACLVLSRPSRRKTIVLDEPFRFVSKEYRPALRDLLQSLSEDLGVQFLLITHIPELVTGKVVEL